MRPSRPLWIAALAAAAASLLLLTAACGDGDDEAGRAGGAGSTSSPVAPPAATAAPTTPATTAPAPATVPAEVYFVRDERVAAVVREVTPPAVARAAMAELLRGPTAEEAAQGLATSIPAGTRLLGLRIAAGVAEVDLSAAFASGGGSLSMLTRVAQVVYTLTAFPTVRAVRFLIEGERVDAIGGEGVIVDPPPTRADLPGQAPASP